MFDIHIISLDSDEGRRSDIARSLSNLKFDFSFISATDGRKLSAIDYFRSAKNRNFWFNRNQFLSPSELGCLLSHTESVRTFVESSSADWLIELEDDVIVDFRLKDFLDRSLSSLDESSIYILGGQEGLPSFRRVILSPVGDESGARRVLFGTHCWLYRTCCFMVHRTVAKELLKLYESGGFVVDNWSYVKRNINCSSIRYIGVVEHPLELGLSRIEEERRFAK